MHLLFFNFPSFFVFNLKKMVVVTIFIKPLFLFFPSVILKKKEKKKKCSIKRH